MTKRDWDPYSVHFEEAEQAARDRKDNRVIPINNRSLFRISVEKAQELSRKWLIPVDRVEDTFDVTTRLASRIFDSPRYSRFGHNFRWLSRKQLGRFFTDTFFCLTSKNGNKAAQLFINDMRFIFIIPMESKSEAPQALRVFLDQVGLPREIVSDNAPEQMSREWTSTLREFNVKHRLIEAYSPWRNYAENGVKTIKF